MPSLGNISAQLTIAKIMREEIDRFGSAIAFVIFYYFVYQFTIYLRRMGFHFDENKLFIQKNSFSMKNFSAAEISFKSFNLAS